MNAPKQYYPTDKYSPPTHPSAPSPKCTEHCAMSLERRPATGNPTTGQNITLEPSTSDIGSFKYVPLQGDHPTVQIRTVPTPQGTQYKAHDEGTPRTEVVQ